MKNDFTQVKGQSKLDDTDRKYPFSQRTTNVWNKLSTNCGHASSVNMLKDRIYKRVTFRIVSKYGVSP